jgi:hypothetical protein
MRSGFGSVSSIGVGFGLELIAELSQQSMQLRMTLQLQNSLRATREWWADTLSKDADDIEEVDAPATG